MSNAFRALLRKIGSGPHTGKHLTRAEAEAATRMMLLQEATPAQIGAFMIAHRIKRPTGEELAGMLDSYEQLGPALPPIGTSQTVTILSAPYDGRTRTMPIGPLVALVLAAADCPVIQHGGDRMPTKDGAPLVDFWRGLGVDWSPLSLERVQEIFIRTQIGFVYLPNHFPLAQGLVPYRDQIGKRPPFATLELMWNPYRGNSHIVAGFVHPPTEKMFRDALALRGSLCFTTVKGLEGSCDLPRDRTAIIGIAGSPVEPTDELPFQRLHLNPRDYDLGGSNVPLHSTADAVAQMQAVLAGQSTELTDSAIWNSGFHLWRAGAAGDLSAGLSIAEQLLREGHAREKLQELTAALNVQPSAASV